MKKIYTFVVTYFCNYETYNVCATLNLETAVRKKIESNYHSIEVWLDDELIGEYGTRNDHSRHDFDAVLNGVTEIISGYELS